MFTRDDTKSIKGFAVLLMLIHHLAGFRSRWPVGFEGFISSFAPMQKLLDLGVLSYFAMNAKICVSIFFFLGGYGFYKRRQAGKFRFMDTLFSLYKSYWKVLFVFIPIGYIFFARSGDGINSLATCFNIGEPIDFLKIQLSNFTSHNVDALNKEWWFFMHYICAIMMGIVFCKTTEKSNSYMVELFAVVGILLVDLIVAPGLARLEIFGDLGRNIYYKRFLNFDQQLCVYFSGIIFAKYNLLEKFKRRVENCTFPCLLSIGGVLLVMLSRMYVVDGIAYGDIFITAPLLAFLSVIFDCARPLKRVMMFLGKHSLNIWLIHSFYCYYYLEVTKIVYCTRSFWIDLLILLALSLVSSILLDLLYAGLGKIWTPLRRKKLQIRADRQEKRRAKEQAKAQAQEQA